MDVDGIEITQSANGVILPVKASAGARQNAFRGIIDGHLKISVRSIAEKGKANQAIRNFLAEKLELPGRRIFIPAGLTSSRKKFELNGISIDQLRNQLETIDNDDSRS